MPVANIPQQAGLEGVGAGHNPAPLLLPNNVQQQREDGDEVRRPPIHVYVPQDHLQVDIEEHAPPARRDGAVVVPPAGGEAAPPAGGEAAPPAGGEAAPPARGEAAPPARGEAAPPAGREVAPPAGREVAPPAGGEVPPAGPTSPAEAIVPQEKVAQIARVTVALAEELLQKQKETVRNIALALNEIIILSHEFANSSIDLRLSDSSSRRKSA